MHVLKLISCVIDSTIISQLYVLVIFVYYRVVFHCPIETMAYCGPLKQQNALNLYNIGKVFQTKWGTSFFLIRRLGPSIYCVIPSSPIKNFAFDPSQIPQNISKSKKESKDQESIQSSTKTDPGYQWESDNFTIRYHKRVPKDQPFPSR